MALHVPVWMSDLHSVLPGPLMGVAVTLTAVTCGAAVGFERGRREKPAGLRTMMLVCLGACIFTQAGLMVLPRGTDPTRIAAQVVTGIGFLGAGAIVRDRTWVIGVTTAAAIWAVAAIGVVIGFGYVIPGVVFTVLTVGTLTAERWIEPWFIGPCSRVELRIRFDPQQGKTRIRIQEILDDHGLPDPDVVERSAGTGAETQITIHYCDRHRQHRAFLGPLAALESVRALESPSPADREPTRAATLPHEPRST
ncbi:MAG: MgtC/SapB family protein [Phycisphaerae bacterium]